MQWDRPLIVTGHPRRAVLLALLGGACLWIGLATAQQPQAGSNLPNPRLFTVMPPGAKAGTTVEVTFTGTDLEEPQGLVFSHPGIKAEPVVPPEPAADPKKPADQKKPEAKPAMKKGQPPPVVTKFKVTVPADTPPGIHDVRLVNKWGVSNPRAFVVGDQTEVLEKEPNNDVAEAQRIEINTTVNGAISTNTDVDFFVFAGKKGQRVVMSCLASSIDSRLMPALELYDVTGRKLAYSRNYHDNDALVDAVLPADGDYYVRLSEFTYTQGSAEHFYRLTITTAPWIDAVFPAAVEPGKSTKVTIHGRNLPGGQPDATALADGRPLDKLVVTVNAPAEPTAKECLAYSGHIKPSASALDGFEYRVRNAAGVSNPFMITFARSQPVLDNENNDTPETAQEVPIPCEIEGRIEKRRDRDWYTFSAKKGDVLNLEVTSERLGAPTAMYFVLKNPATKSDIFESPDNNDVMNPKFYARTDDPPVYKFTVPADGKYQLMVASRHGDVLAGPRHLYRLHIAPAQPDFRLVVMAADEHRPDSAVLHRYGCQSLTVMAWRLDGFSGDIALTVEGLPPGVNCPTQTIGAGLRHATLVLSDTTPRPTITIPSTNKSAQAVSTTVGTRTNKPAQAVSTTVGTGTNKPTEAAVATVDTGPPDWTGEIKIKGTATIKGRPVTREARAASITWPVQPQQNIPAISRLDRGLFLAVRDQAPYNLTATIDKATLSQGEKATIAVKLARHWPDFKTPLQVQAQVVDLPPNNVITFNNNQPLNMAPGKDDGTMAVDVKTNCPPGVYNVVLRTSAQIPYNKDPKAAQKPPTNVVLPSTPVKLTVLPKNVGTLSLPGGNPTIKIGAQADVVIKVTRLFDYAGEFKLQLVLPANVKGLTAADVTIPAGSDEAKLVVKAAADGMPGNRADLIVRATAMLGTNMPVVQETKLSVNVVK
jgi:hypothetical protein